MELMMFAPHDLKFLKLAQAVKRESHDPVRQVGAVIATPSGDLLSTGTNRPPEALGLGIGQSAKRSIEDVAWKYFVLEHAERDAINNARNNQKKLSGATIYATLFPCADCARAVIAAGIRRIVVPEPDLKNPANHKWLDHFRYSMEMFREAGISVDFAPDANGEVAIDDSGRDPMIGSAKIS